CSASNDSWALSFRSAYCSNRRSILSRRDSPWASPLGVITTVYKNRSGDLLYLHGGNRVDERPTEGTEKINAGHGVQENVPVATGSLEDIAAQNRRSESRQVAHH